MPARQPRAPSASTAAIAASPGTATIAASGVSGRLATSEKAGSPWTVARFGLTGRSAPAKPRALR
jgi:hypothetical protein